MFRLPLFKIRAFAFGSLSTFLSAVARGGAAVHADHLAAGHLAARARLRLHQHRRCGPASTWCRLIVGMLVAGPTSGLSVRPLRGARVRHRRHGRRGAELLPLLTCCPPTSPIRSSRSSCCSTGVDGHVRLANRGGGDEQPAAPATVAPAAGMNQTFQNSAQVLSIGNLLHADDRRAGLEPPHTLSRGLHAHGVPVRDRPHDRRAATGVDPVRGLPRLQPDPAAGRPARPGDAVGPQPGGAHGPTFFPHLISAPFRSGLHAAFAFAHRRLPDRRGPPRSCAVSATSTHRASNLRGTLPCACSGTDSPPSSSTPPRGAS